VRTKALNAFWLDNRRAGSEELKLVLPKELLQAGNELAPKHTAEHSYGQEEALL